jgi:hypothetical protein
MPLALRSLVDATFVAHRSIAPEHRCDELRSRLALPALLLSLNDPRCKQPGDGARRRS